MKADSVIVDGIKKNLISKAEQGELIHYGKERFCFFVVEKLLMTIFCFWDIASEKKLSGVKIINFCWEAIYKKLLILRWCMQHIKLKRLS